MKTREEMLVELKSLDRITKKVSMEHLRLFIENEKQKRAALGEGLFECFVMDIKDLKAFLTHHLASAFPINKRFQLIIHNKDHYLAIDILWGEDEKKCLLLDAANDFRMIPVSFALKAFPFDQIFLARGILDTKGRSINLQNDLYSCPIFALDHAFQLSKMNIYRKLEGTNFHRNTNSVNWEQLPIQLIWNAQSLKFLDEYLEKNTKLLTQCELKEYSEYSSKNIQVSPEGKKINAAIDNIFDLLIKNAIPFVENLEENQILSILEGNTFIPPMKIKETVDSNVSNNQSFFKPLSSVNMENIDGIAAINLGKN